MKTLTHRHGVSRKKKDDQGRMKEKKIGGEGGEREEQDADSRVIVRISKCVYKLGHRRLADMDTAAWRADREAAAAGLRGGRFAGR